MTDKQLQTVVALLSGMQFAVVHLSNVLCEKAGITHDDLAQSFEKTGEKIPEAVQNRDVHQMVFRQIAAGIRRSGTDQEFQELMNRLMH